MVDDEFAQTVFALCTQWFLDGSLNLPTLRKVVYMGIAIRYHLIPGVVLKDECDDGKCTKYLRDILTERGLINCLARETKSHDCSCMDAKKEEAKTMGKVAECFGCKKSFPKHFLVKCSGCNFATYCSPECQGNDWSSHKKECKAYLEKKKKKKESQKANLPATFNDISHSLGCSGFKQVWAVEQMLSAVTIARERAGAAM